ncbi:unnamed protein product, partial [Rotaria sp. Silwood1]
MNSFTSSGTPIDNQVKSTDQLRKHLNTIISQWYLNHRVKYRGGKLPLRYQVTSNAGVTSYR